MKTTQSHNSNATAGGHTPTRPELTFDGIGINGPDQYRTRVATFNGDENAQKYGPIFSQAPAMLEALKATREMLRSLENRMAQYLSDDECRELSCVHKQALAILAAVEGTK